LLDGIQSRPNDRLIVAYNSGQRQAKSVGHTVFNAQKRTEITQMPTFTPEIETFTVEMETMQVEMETFTRRMETFTVRMEGYTVGM
jgi:hypothetical protein